MVVFAAAIFTLVLLLSPTEGLVTKWLQRHRIRRHIQGEDILKTLYRFVTRNAQSGQTAFPIDQIYPFARVNRRQGNRIISQLENEGLLFRVEDGIALTEEGTHRAIEMVRSHRLWESYLTRHAGVSAAEVHEQAEELEHVHDLADEIDRDLGHPEHDPHGEEIPRPPKTSE